MAMKGIAMVVGVFTLAVLLFAGFEHSPSLRKQVNFQIVYKTITGVLRAPLTVVSVQNDTVVAADSKGGINIWTYNEKKKKLEFQDTSRPVVPVLPADNNVLAMDSSQSEGVVVLTSDGKLATFPVNSASKITGKVDFNNADLFSDFKVIKKDGSTYFATISSNQNTVCLYQAAESIIRASPLTKLACNSSTKALSGLSYDSINSLIAVGDQSQAVIYAVNLTDIKPTLTYLCEANLPKADAKGFDSQFKNGTLLAINDLWVMSILIDTSGPSAKVLSSERTERVLVKTGMTTALAVNLDEKSKQTRVLVNTKTQIKGYDLPKSQKLSFANESQTLGRSEHFTLLDQSTLLSTQSLKLIASSVAVYNTSDKDYLSNLDSSTIVSPNHFQKVNKMAYWNNTLVSISEGGEANFKIWNTAAFALSEVDEKTISFFTILKQGVIRLKDVVMIPPPAKANANATLHIATAGADLFEVILVNINAQGKIGSVVKSKDSHSNNITGIFVTPDHKTIVTASMDSYAKVWQLTNNTSDVADNATSVATKYGGIKVALQDKSGQFYIFGHSMTNTSGLVNITIWKTDEKKGLVKVAENVPGEAHESNLTSMLFCREEKYIITFSESGEIRLWRHENYTMIDLLASLSIGNADISLTITTSNRLLIQSKTEFTEYSFDFNGFILEGRKTKQYPTVSSSMLMVEDKLYSGDADGSIRVYQHTD